MHVLRLILVGVAVLIVAALGVRLTFGPRPPQPQATLPAPAEPSAPPRVEAPAPERTRAARDRLEAALREAPELQRAFETLKVQFPAIAERALAGASAKWAETGEATAPDDLLAGAVRELRQNAGVLAAKAGPQALTAMFESKAAILAGLAAGDPRVCADFVYGGSSPEYADFAAGHRALEAQSAMASILATAEGRKLKIERGAPTPDDFKLMEAGLAAKGLSPEEIAALLDGKSLDPPLPDERLCSDARTYLDVIKTLPEDVRLRVYGLSAELLARS